MRLRLLFLMLLPATASAASPPLCALPAPVTTVAADTGPAFPSAERPTPTGPQAPALRTMATPIPAALADTTRLSSMWRRREARSRISVRRTACMHSRRGTEISSCCFDVTPDGQAAVSGAPVEITPAQIQTIAAGNVTDLGLQHGLQGYFVRSGAQFQVFYATPDQQRLVPGVMWDASGKDLTRAQVAAYSRRDPDR